MLLATYYAELERADDARRDSDLTLLHGDPEFERIYPEVAGP